VSIDAAIFFNRYHHLVTSEQGAPFPEDGHTVQPIFFDNKSDARSRGLEIAATWRPLPRWRLSGWYAFFDLTVAPFPDSTDAETDKDTGPRHQAQVLSSLDLGSGFSFDALLRYVDDLPTLGVRRYLRTDLRVAWRARPGLEASAGVDNLQRGSHAEFIQDTDIADGSLIERAWYARLAWRY
jgi:outer membrane receptor protein involved in Fe transport